MTKPTPTPTPVTPEQVEQAHLLCVGWLLMLRAWRADYEAQAAERSEAAS